MDILGSTQLNFLISIQKGCTPTATQSPTDLILVTHKSLKSAKAITLGAEKITAWGLTSTEGSLTQKQDNLWRRTEANT